MAIIAKLIVKKKTNSFVNLSCSFPSLKKNFCIEFRFINNTCHRHGLTTPYSTNNSSFRISDANFITPNVTLGEIEL